MAFRTTLRTRATLLLLLPLCCPAYAHVGTASAFVQAKAGPYPLYVTITPPAVIPGEATVSVITDGSTVRSISLQANVLSGDLAHDMPQAVALTPGPPGSHEFHGTAWIMTQGSWQVRLLVNGTLGSGSLSVPLPASPTRLMHMSRPFGALLLVLGGVLIAGLASLASAAAREAGQTPGALPDATQKARGRRAAAFAVFAVVVLLLFFNRLWKQEVARYSGNIYQPLQMSATLSGTTLHLALHQPSDVQALLNNRTLADLVLDHNHLMHLYMVRWPAMDVVYHLHPEQISAGNFDLPLPTVPAGSYKLFADVVHADGFPETAVSDIELNVPQGRPLAGDDASGLLPAIHSANAEPDVMRLPDGYQYRFTALAAGPSTPSTARSAYQVRANVPVLLRFTLLDARGDAPQDMVNYMGMPGHVAIIKPDGSVFAHIHPDGSIAMAAYMMANAKSAMPMGAMGMSTPAVSNTAAFPFGFPKAGLYRIIVQMKHGSMVETGAVDLNVAP
jgi:hypothetical protein